jgi:ribosomal protein S17E
VILTTLDNAIQGELQSYENNYKALNLITTILSKNVYDRIAQLERS